MLVPVQPRTRLTITKKKRFTISMLESLIKLIANKDKGKVIGIKGNENTIPEQRFLSKEFSSTISSNDELLTILHYCTINSDKHAKRLWYI